MESEDLRGGIERANCSLQTGKKYADVGGNCLGKDWLRKRETLPFKRVVKYPKITDLRQLGTYCVISGFRRGVSKIFCFSGMLQSSLLVVYRNFWAAYRSHCPLKKGPVGCPETPEKKDTLAETDRHCVTSQNSEDLEATFIAIFLETN